MPDPFSAIGEVFASNAQADAIDSAANTQKDASAYAADVQKQMYDKQVALQQPFLNTGYAGNSMLAALLTGQPVSYNAPGATEASKTDVAKANWAAIQANPSLAGADFWKDVNNGEDPMARLMRQSTSDNSTLPYDATKTYYTTADGGITDKPAQVTFDPNSTAAQSYQLPAAGEIPSLANLPDYSNTVTANYDSIVPKTDLPSYDEMVTNAKLVDDPTYQWRVQEGTTAANRNLASRGLSGGGQAVTSLSNLVSSIGADETAKQYTRNQSRYSAALQDALAKYGMNTDRYNATRSGQEKLYAANTDNALNLYNAGMKTYGLKTDLANTNYGRLTDALKVGQNAAGTIGAASQNYGSSAAGTAMTGANNLANAQLAQGATQANLYSTLGNMPSKTAISVFNALSGAGGK